jgi:hypothetical protein
MLRVPIPVRLGIPEFRNFKPVNLPEIIIVASHVPILIAVGYAAARYRRFGSELRVFSWFLFLSGVIQFVSLFFWFHHWNNMPLLHLYVAAGFVCLAWFYRTVLGGWINAGIIWLATALFLLFSVANSLFIQPVLTFNSNALTVESVLVVILTLFTFLFLLNDSVRETGGHEVKSLGWINSGLFIYYTSSLLIFYFGATIMQRFSVNLSQYAWIYHSFFSVVMYTCFSIGLWRRSGV